MRSARVVPISDDPHFTDYAELPDLQRIEEADWSDHLTDRLQKDREAEALFWISICLAIVVAICAWGPK